MCQPTTNTRRIGTNHFDTFIHCTLSGKPIVMSNEYGMFCADMCELDKCKKAHKTTKELCSIMATLFEHVGK